MSVPVYALFTTAAALATVALAADVAPSRSPGWTGITNPKDVIMARQELMEHIEDLMEPIDTIQVEAVRHPENLRAAAKTISVMLLAVPHLFPPTTNLYDPKAQMPATLALPAIWENFATFYGLATAASRAAQAMAVAQGNESLRAASRGLRASCDACHLQYLRPYAPPKILDSDYKFDFDSALPKK
jgi:cytochrome c556